ncbi:Ig-like domain-containing protein [Massilimicrobiota sp. An134]|uniref:Ig-like domain-containing protein n=1 Tax=Massilimicrobiota sp. An134 TaxID=1965557 RepID=UPI000B3AE098|nr:Ig-like domain-containing protein [Massilimicrobiota sp. An134]OUQ30381.1 hypothetical protein B5E79_03785 [Massilimicrobiota sp. An134]
MKKRILSLCMILVLCLSLLPATALAAAPDGQVLYVGGVQISSTGYWTTDSEGNVTAYTGEGTPSDNYIHYDADTNTLTLHNATIKEEVPYNTSTYVAGAAIGVHNQNGAAELTITLEGTNTIAEVGKGIYVLANSTGGATLTITGDGSLDASASQTGIWVQSNNGNGTLFIQNAKVETTGTNTAGYGVNVQSSNSSTAALTVDGGSLTASGSPGILYDSIGSGTVPKTTALTISDSAIVDARGGGIGAGSTTNLQPVLPSGDGTVFDGKEGIVYGDVTLQEDLIIGDGESLKLADNNARLDANNHNVIVDGGTVDDSIKNSLGDSVKYTPTIITTSLSNGIVGQPYSVTLSATGTDSITWSLANGSKLPNGLTLNENTGEISGTPIAEGTSTFTITATNHWGSDDKELSLTIGKIAVIGVSLDKKTLNLTEGKNETLIATVKPDNATNKNVIWESSDSNVVTVDKSGNVTAKKAGKATITVKTEDGNFMDTCEVTVMHGNMTYTAANAPTCTADGNTEYWTCESCGQYFSDVNGTTEIQLEDTVVTALGHSYKEVKWNWMDNENCTATLICTNDKSHSITAKAVVSSIVKVPATCTNMGVTQYKATVVFDGQTYTNIKEVTDQNMLAHHYSDGRCVMCGAEDPNYQRTTKPIDDNMQSDDKDSQTTTTVNNDTIKSVKTGDMTYLTGWFFLLSVSAFIGAIVFYKKKKTE